jgi:hypothetical protein
MLKPTPNLKIVLIEVTKYQPHEMRVSNNNGLRYLRRLPPQNFPFY